MQRNQRGALCAQHFRTPRKNIGGYDIILVARARTPYLKSTQLSKTLAGLMRKAGLPDKAAAVPQQPAAKPQPNGAPE